jgi:HlyD family secretion protein
LAATFSGVIQELYCDYNTQVKQGQVCAKIDPRPYRATLDQYSGQLLRDQAVLDKDRIDLARYQKLAVQQSIAQQQADDSWKAPSSISNTPISSRRWTARSSRAT